MFDLLVIIGWFLVGVAFGRYQIKRKQEKIYKSIIEGISLDIKKMEYDERIKKTMKDIHDGLEKEKKE